MKIKRFLFLTLAALSLCAMPLLASCGGESSSADGSAGDGDYTLVEDGKLTVAASLDFPPFENLNGNKIEGFEVDVMYAIAEELGLEINYLPTMKFDTIIPAIVAGGTADVGVSGFTITPQREEEVDFTTPICDTNQCIVVPAGSDITDVSQLEGVRVGAETGTTGLDWAKEHLTGAQEIVAFDEYPAVFAALQSNQVAAVVLDKPVADYYINIAYPDCQVVKEIPTGEQYGIAVSENNPALTEAINTAITTLHEDGTMAKLNQKWFGTEVAPQADQPIIVEACTAAPNEDGGERVLGDTPTRVSWRAHAAEGESLSKIVLTFPEGVTFNADKVKVTGLNELDRIDLNQTIEAPGDGTLVITMPEGTPEGISFLVEVYNVIFPADGGNFQVSASGENTAGEAFDLGEQGGTMKVSAISTAERIGAWLNQQSWVQAWNSNKFLHLFFNPAIIATSIPSVFHGWLTALGIVVISFPCAIPIGFALALMRMSRFRVLRAIGSTYVNVVRGTPMFLQIYIAFFGLPLLGLNVLNFVLGCCVMTMNSSAYLCEIFRAGITSISKGQFEAARSLGMNSAQTMIHVIAPQAFRRVIPTMTNELILLYKDTSLLAAVGIMETVMYAKTITAATGNITPYIVAAMFYLIVTLPMSRITRHLEDSTGERKVALKKTTERKKPKDPESAWGPAVDPAKDELAIKTADL